MSAVSRQKSGFTLVEILIVVIILGILAAIVIPQFTDASTSAKQNSLTSQVQTIRSQLELFKSAHSTSASSVLFATTTSDKTQWQELTGKTLVDGTYNAATGTFGPYLQTLPVNNLNGKSGVLVSTTAIDETSTVAAGKGFVYDTTTGKFWATNLAGTGIWSPTN